jgi:AmmeMemoRadiSam system protein B
MPAVAGRFYPDDADELAVEVANYLERGKPDGAPRKVHACMAPHAGYVYSGGIAGQTFAAIEVPERVIVLCPNHTGRGKRIAVIPEGSFALPGADVKVDEELARHVLEEVVDAEHDREAHRFEHAIEVELPFLLARRPDVKIVPIVLAGVREHEAIELGEALHRATEKVDGDVLIVASSDMSHFLPDDTTRKVDRVALEPLLAFDPGGLYRTVVENDISMCGYIPATAMLAYARKQRAGAPELIGYATSGDAFGDRSRVVGYAGVVIPAEENR